MTATQTRTATRFQSTLSLRRATGPWTEALLAQYISIHALLAESDPYRPVSIRQPRQISIHALLAESDSKYHQIGPIVSV